MGQQIAAEMDLEFYLAERLSLPQNDGSRSARYVIPRPLRTLLGGKSVAVVDDVINAGSATRGILAELHTCAAKPVIVGALLILGDSMPTFLTQQGLPYTRLAALQNEIWLPEHCPLCASGAPLDSTEE